MSLPVTIALRPSRRLRLLLGAAHAVALLAVLPLHLHWSLRLTIAELLLTSWLIHWRRKPEIVGLTLGKTGELEVATNVGAEATAPQAAQLLPGTTVLPGGLILALRVDGRRHTLAVLPDSLAGDDYRRLRVWLGWRARR